MACYLVTSEDKKIAELVQGWVPADAARLRGMYDEQQISQGKSTLDLSDFLKAAKTLVAFRNGLIKKIINRSSTDMVKSFKDLKDYTPETRYNRTKLIANMFSSILDRALLQNPNASRTEICNSSQFLIFNQVYEDLRRLYSTFSARKDEKRAEEIKKMLDNFGALCAYSRVILRDTEGLLLGNNVQYADNISMENLGDNDLSSLFDPSESSKEHWQESNDFISSFSTIGQAVRRVLSTIEQIDDRGLVVKDDIGVKTYLNPVTAHQQLLEELRGVTSEDHLIEIIQNSSIAYKKQLLDILQNNPLIRTLFFLDFKKAFQTYKEVEYQRQDDGSVKVKTFIKNKVRNLLLGQYNLAVRLGVQLNSQTSVYNNDGSINWANVQRVRLAIKRYFTPKTTSVIEGAVLKVYNSKNPTEFYKLSEASKIKVMTDISEALGINLDSLTASRIVNSRKQLRDFTKHLQELVMTKDGKDSGIDALLTNEDKQNLDNGNYDKLSYKSKKFKDFLKALTKTQEQTRAKEGNVEEKIKKILNIVSQEREAFRVESRITHKDRKGKSNTLYSYVKPCFMSDLIELINSFHKRGRYDLLRKYLDSRYLDSSMFKLNGKILNRWIEDLYNSNDSTNGNFAEKLTYSRFLGSEDTDFENFTSKLHAIEMINEFFFAENDTYTYNDIDDEGKVVTKTGKYSYYPVFILGDSGVCKYIKARRYTRYNNDELSFDEILEGLYNVYQSECQRNLLVRAANESLTKGHYKTIDNVKETGFKLLPFLNEAKYRPQTWTKDDIKMAIRKYMDDAVVEFKQNMERLGVLEKTDNGTYKWLNTALNSESAKYKGNIDMMLADYFWNTKFATIQQFQLMTVDVAFYKSTKDLQKRYKEIHAPGDAVSIQARDFDGNLYSEDGIETCCYFDDPQINAEETNPEFMNAIAYQYGTGETYEERVNSGKETDIYKQYKKNALADGQGYRTLQSYRKVMGMAGKWTREMENAYNKIQALRALYGEDADIPALVLDEIAALTVTFQPIKPYMFTIENFDMKEEGKVLKIPVQHKYAEALLIPELLPKGSKLRHIALWMESKNVDIVGAWSKGGDKIVKVGGFGSVNIDSADTREKLNMALDNAYVHKLNYSDYRIQTNVPEHINSSQLFGTQLRKLIMAGINKAKSYSHYIGGQKVNIGGQMTVLNGRNLINFYNSLIVAGIIESYEQFEQEVKNPKQLAQVLQQAVINNSRESLDNLLAFALDGDEFHLPLFEGGIEHDTAAMLLSIFKKKVNKQKIKGGSAVQVSAMGTKGYEKSGDLKYVTSEDGKNILYAEVEMPWDITVNMYLPNKDANGNFVLDKNGEKTYSYQPVELKFSDYCKDDGTLIMTKKGDKSLLEQKFPDILNRICYRIPTERDYSMMNVKIVRFSQKTAGGTIKVPAQGTTIAGFDFDIDKLYFMMRDYYAKPNEIADNLPILTGVDNAITQELANTLELEEYDLTKSVLEQHSNPEIAKALRNNMLITLISQRLQDVETFKERTTPGGFANKSTDARQMREILYGNREELYTNGVFDFEKLAQRARENDDPEPNYDPSDPMTIITYNLMNLVAGKLIGIFANQNTNHAFASLMEVFKLKVPVSFCGHSYNDLLKAPEGIDTALNIAECLAASVDAVKDPVLNYLNFNTVTANAAGLLARLGYTGLEIGLLFNQPIVKEVCEAVFNNNSSIDRELKAALDKYIGLLKDKHHIGDANFEASTLADSIMRDRERIKNNQAMSIQDMNYQLEILDLFSDILQLAEAVNSFITATKFTASNAVSSTFGDMYAQQLKVEKYILSVGGKSHPIEMKVSRGISPNQDIDAPIDNGTHLITDKEEYLRKLILDGVGNPFAYEQAMYDMNVRAIQLLNQYYPYETATYEGVRNEAQILTKRNIDGDTVNDLHRELLQYMLAQQEGDFNGYGTIVYTEDGQRKEINRRDYYLKVFPQRLYEVLEKNPDLKSLAIFQYMLFNEDSETGLTELKLQDVGGLSPQQKDSIRDSWTELAIGVQDLNYPNGINPLARDLFMYCYFKKGFEFSPKSFMHLAPVTLKDNIVVNQLGMTYTEFLRKILNSQFTSLVNAELFMKQFIANHTDNYLFTYRSKKGKSASELDKVISGKSNPTGKQFVPSFSIGLSELGDSRNNPLLINVIYQKDAPPISYWTPCITIQGNIYMADYPSPDFNKSTSNEMTYRWVGEESKDVQYKVDTVSEGSTTSKEEVPPVVDNSQGNISIEMANKLADAMVRNAIANNMLGNDNEIRDFRESMINDIMSHTGSLQELIQEAELALGELRDECGNKIC